LSPFRPDLVDCWLFRVAAGLRSNRADRTVAEILLLRRSPGRILPGLWQCVSGSVEPDERIAAAARREVIEETGVGPDDIDAFYDLDLVNQFHEPSVDAIVTSAVFAARLRPGVEAKLSHEHDGARWVTIDEAHDELVWPGYREAIVRIRDDVLDPAREPWFRLDADGRRGVQ
jgi:8-oxo-dGTP pyrophosphatase MutT (NUDIX family)